MQHLRLTHPALDLWIDVRLREFDGRWLAVAELADTPEVGTGETPEEALEVPCRRSGRDSATSWSRAPRPGRA